MTFEKTSADTTPATAVGFDTAAVEAWLATQVPQFAGPLRWVRLEGGHSNLTYRLESTQGARAVIRRPPMGELLPMAHDMAREWSLISALGGTAVPVPPALAFCSDLQVTGCKFYVMGFVDGRPLYTLADAEQMAPEPLRQRIAHSFIDVLAALHAVDPDAVGLGSLGRKDGYVGRQVKTWYRSWTESIDGAGLDDARAHDLQRYFLDHLPDQGPARIVHGDYGLHNTLIGHQGSQQGRIAAVVDWEISTLGDPLADLAYALNQWAEPADPPGPRGPGPTSLPGFPSRRALADRYAQHTGRDLSRLDYYIGFNRWKSAAIVHGVYARYLQGKKSTEGVDLPGLRSSVLQSLALAEAAVNRLEQQA